MRVSSLQVKVTLAIVLSLLVIDGVGAAVAEYNFRASETQHARQEAATRVKAMSHVLDLRFHALGQSAFDILGTASSRPDDELMQAMRRAGFTGSLLLRPDGSGWRAGDAESNDSLATLLETTIPDAQFPGRFVRYEQGWLLVGVRAVGKSAIAGAIDSDTLSTTFLNDVLTESVAADVIVTKEGQAVASSVNFAGSDDLTSLTTLTLTTLADGEEYLVSSEPLTGIQASIAHLVPTAGIEARVDALVWRFVATSTAAVVLAGIASVIIVAFALRPLRRITDAARKLGAGDETLDLHIRSRDEMGVLADALTQSARAIADARRAQDAHADELRLAAEDFQVAVGALARSVGEADTAPEIARRLAEAVLLVTPSAAAAVLQRDAVLELRLARADDGDDAPDEHAVRALLASDAEAFRWFHMPSQDDEVRVAILSPGGLGLGEADGRKVEILLNQAALAFHRARSMDSLRRAHDELDDLLRQKQVFVDILSHDLKNPIAVARGRAEMLSMKHPEVADKAKPIEQALDRATKIIEEAVLFSRLERESRLERPVVDLSALASEATHSLAPLAATRGIEVVCSAPAQVRWKANHLLVRAIENLLSNAIKWSPERSTVIVDVEAMAHVCRIRVVDHGPGIPPEDRHRLFARFERADRTGVKGVGLGLAIAKRVVDMHDGRITIEDTPGGGCTFVVELPAEAASPSVSVAAPSQEGPA